MNRVRMDKWLWAARFFKTRSLAADACEHGRIESNGLPAKASREVRVGDLLQIKNDGGDFQVEVLVGSERGGPGAVARPLCGEPEVCWSLRRRLVGGRKGMHALGALREGGPSNRARREMERFRGRE